MKPIAIEGTTITPAINFDPQKGCMEIKGRSILENSKEFYRPLDEWLDQYMIKPAKITEMNIQLDYFNTTSSKCIFDVLKKIKAIYSNGNEVIINWYYEEEDDTMLFAGLEYQAMVMMPFKIKGVVE